MQFFLLLALVGMSFFAYASDTVTERPKNNRLDTTLPRNENKSFKNVKIRTGYSVSRSEFLKKQLSAYHKTLNKEKKNTFKKKNNKK